MRMLFVVFVILTIFHASFYAECENVNQNIERNKMNEIKKDQNQNLIWIDRIKKEINVPTGQFRIVDNCDNQIVLQWELIDPTSPRLNEAIKESAEILVQMYKIMELQFAKKHPETVSSEMFLKSLVPLFKNGVDKVDWKVAEQKLTESLRQFLTTTDFAKYGNAEDVQLFVTAKDAKSDKLLGFIQFLVMPQFDYGTIKVAMFGVDSSSQDCGMELLLLSSVFELMPDISKIFLHTRITNEAALNLYQNIGFTKVAGPLPFWADMEYLIENSKVLQQTAKSLKNN